mgnify:CR=1 FL=1
MSRMTAKLLGGGVAGRAMLWLVVLILAACVPACDGVLSPAACRRAHGSALAAPAASARLLSLRGGSSTEGGGGGAAAAALTNTTAEAGAGADACAHVCVCAGACV